MVPASGRPVILRRPALLDVPFRGEPCGQRFGVDTVGLFDPVPAADPSHFRMCNPGVLVDLAEQVLAVDELQRPSPEALKYQTKPVEFYDLNPDFDRGILAVMAAIVPF